MPSATGADHNLIELILPSELSTDQSARKTWSTCGGKLQKIHEGYLASRRSPWYSQEKREPAPFLCTYMGRIGKGRKPFRFIWNKSRATASNLYLMMYPKAPLRTALAADKQLYAAVHDALGEIDTELFLREGRVYGGGLHKMEPKELGRLPAGPIAQAAGIELARQNELFPVE
jgi:hypothetical protein